MTINNQFEWDGVLGFKFGQSLFGSPKMYSHVYYVDGLLIDTGHRRMHKIIFDRVKNLAVKQILITHHHEDHTGNLNTFEKYFSCPAHASKQCCEIMKNPPFISFAQRITWGDRPDNHHLRPISGILKTQNHEFEIIPIPGHASDQIALYERKKKWLFSADLFVNSYIKMFLHSESMIQQIESIRYILELDFDILFCGHNPKQRGGKALLKKKLDFFEDLYNNVKTQYQHTTDPKKIFKNLNLKESWEVRLLSHGYLSKLNMVRSAIRDIEREKDV